jgi:Cof subfamily protein (haloacid dehalogenase superfamily)
MYNIDMQYRLIASDYDHTLTGPDDTVSKTNYDYIEYYLKNGGFFCINTGREKPSIFNVVNNSPLGKLDIIICSHQGALITRAKTKEVLYKSTLKIEDVLKVMNYLKTKTNQESFVFSEDNIICEKRTNFIQDYVKVLKISTPIIQVKSYEQYFKTTADLPMKINVTSSKRGLKIIIKEVLERYNLTFTDIGYSMAELVAPNTSKGEAHKFVCNYLHIPLENSVGIGDSQNDISLIKEAGLGIAVDNACKELKSVADLIVINTNHDAVANIIYKVVKGTI